MKITLQEMEQQRLFFRLTQNALDECNAEEFDDILNYVHDDPAMTDAARRGVFEAFLYRYHTKTGAETCQKSQSGNTNKQT